MTTKNQKHQENQENQKTISTASSASRAGVIHPDFVDGRHSGRPPISRFAPIRQRRNGRLLAALIAVLAALGSLRAAPLLAAAAAENTPAATAPSAVWVIVPDLKVTTSNWGEAKGMELDRAIDGDVSTFYWSGREVRTGDWLELDLGADYQLNGVRFLMATTASNVPGDRLSTPDGSDDSIDTLRPNDYVYSGQVLVRAASGAWQVIGELAGQAEVEVRFPSRPVRYLRLRVTQNQVYWVQIREIQLLAESATAAGGRAYRPVWLKIRAAEEAYARAADARAAAESRWDDVDDRAIRPLLDQAQTLLSSARAAYEEQADAEAAQRAAAARSLAEQAAALTIESRIAEVRAVWVDRPALLAGPDAVRSLLDRLAKLGVNLIFPEMVWRSAAAFPSEIAPRDPEYWRWGDVDPLAFITAEAHARGIQVAPWVWVFAAGYYHEFGPLLKEHPDWAELSRDGSPFSPTEWGTAWLNISLPQVRTYLQHLLLEIVTKYDVDGIHFDYIRFNEESHAPFGYSPATLQRFAEETGLDAQTLTPGSPAASRWDEWREQLITSFLQETVEKLRQVRPSLLISAAVVPDPQAARRETHQNWPLWLKQGWLDFVATMNYTAFPGEFWSRTRLAQEAAGPAKVLPGLGIWLVTPERMLDEIASARELLSPGVVLFAASTLQGEFFQRLADGPFRNRATSPLADPAGAWNAQLLAFLRKWQRPQARQALPELLFTRVEALAHDHEALVSTAGSTGETLPHELLPDVEGIIRAAESGLTTERLTETERAALTRLRDDAHYLATLAQFL